MAATKDLLGELHSAIAADLLARIQSGGATAAELSTAIKFLKDNNIEAIAEQNEGLSALLKALPDFDEDAIYN